LLDGCWFRPVFDSFQFGGVHQHFPFFQDHSEVFDAHLLEFAFAGFQIEIVVMEFLENYLHYPFEVFLCFAENKDVVHINNNPFVVDLVFEDVVHYALEGCQ